MDFLKFLIVLVASWSVQSVVCQAFYIRTCHYFGKGCGHAVGEQEGKVLRNFSVNFGDIGDRNISCGATASQSIEYCKFPEKYVDTEPDLNKYQCYSAYRFFSNSSERLLISAGCIFGHSLDLCSRDSCNFSHSVELPGSHDSVHYCCCHTTDNCNLNRIIGHPPTGQITVSTTHPSTREPVTSEPINESSSSSRILVVLAILLPVVAICAVVIICTCCWMAHKRRSMGDSIQELQMDSITGSSSGNNSRRDVPQVDGALIIFRKEGSIIGRGRFSSVHRGELDGDDVAIKVFIEKDELAWQNEWVIYNTLRVQHPNILYFRGAKEAMNGMMKERYLVTEYHRNGSLSDYLKQNTVTYGELCQKGISIARGLEFLHTQKQLRFIPPYTKPTIAHRDLKSKNILVKENGECCVSDFGLATSFGVNESLTERQGKVGTTRYMAPEVLEGAITFQMESFLRIDIYAFALVMWELIIRCKFNGEPAQDHREPFVDEVGPSSTQQDMLCCVVTKKQRPRFPPHCANHERIDAITKIVTECWDPDPEARLSAQCFLDNLTEVITDPNLQGGDDGAGGKDQVVEVPNKEPGYTNGGVSTSGVGTGGTSLAYDVTGQSGSTSGPPAYSSGNFGHDGGVPNVLIRNNSDYHSVSTAAPPQYATAFSEDVHVPYANGSARMANGGSHRYDNHEAHDAAILLSVSSLGPGSGSTGAVAIMHPAAATASEGAPQSNGHVPNGCSAGGVWNNNVTKVHRQPINGLHSMSSSSSTYTPNGLSVEHARPQSHVHESSL